jgi:pyruvate dehydrogenase E2 component (dihydrolipoamide acetyltransferase)
MAKIVGLPKLSPTMEEGTLARWVKQEGDAFEVDDLIAEVETDKATMEWRAFDPGVLLKILVEEGTELAPEAPVAIFGEAGEDISGLLAELEAGGGGAPEAVAPAAEPAPEAPAPAAAPAVAPAPAATPTLGDGGRVLASPLVRRLALEHGVDLTQVGGTGPHGRVVKRDLDAYLASPRPAAAAEPVAPPVGSIPDPSSYRVPPRVEKLSRMRKTIARRLTESKQTIPHFYLTIDARVDALLSLRKEFNARLKESGEKLSVNDFILKACAVALRRLPEVNATYAGDDVYLHEVVDLSMAVAIEGGLVTPVIRDADRKGLREIAKDSKELAAKARDKKLQPEEMSGGTFSVSNLGMFGVTEFSAVINPGEGAILAVGTFRDVPAVKDGALTVEKRMSFTLSCDHRVIDGALGARWLQIFQEILEEPALMLL